LKNRTFVKQAEERIGVKPGKSEI